MSSLVKALADAAEHLRDAYTTDPVLYEVEPPGSIVLEADLGAWVLDLRTLENEWMALG